jgi:hypothetical protein
MVNILYSFCNTDIDPYRNKISQIVFCRKFIFIITPIFIVNILY